jgi:hypothetical protein
MSRPGWVPVAVAVIGLTVLLPALAAGGEPAPPASTTTAEVTDCLRTPSPCDRPAAAAARPVTTTMPVSGAWCRYRGKIPDWLWHLLIQLLRISCPPDVTTTTSTSTTSTTAPAGATTTALTVNPSAGSFHTVFQLRAVVHGATGQPVTTGSVRFEGEFGLNHPPPDQQTVSLDANGVAFLPCVRLPVSSGYTVRAVYLGAPGLETSQDQQLVWVRPSEPTASTTTPCG